MPGTLLYLCSEPSVSEQLLFVLLMEAREHRQSLGDSGTCGQAGSCHLGTLFFPSCGRRGSDSLPQPNFPCLCRSLGSSSSQEPEHASDST